MREFFENLREDTGTLQSTMKNTVIVLSERKLGHLLEMPKTGICYPSLENDLVGLKRILERDDVENFDFHKANQLPTKLLLHSIVSRIIDRKSTRLNSSHSGESRMPSSA